MFLVKKQEWCHIIVIVVPQGATRIVKIKKREKSGKFKGLRGKVARLRNTLGHEKCPRFPSPLWNSALPDRQPNKSENRSGFIAMWERTGTNKQCFDERDKSCEERAFYRYLTCLVFEYFETSFMSAKKEFLARCLREKSGWSKLWKRFYICCLVPISQKRKRGKHEEGIYPLFWCFSCVSLELMHMNFFLQKIPFLGQLGSHHAC